MLRIDFDNAARDFLFALNAVAHNDYVFNQDCIVGEGDVQCLVFGAHGHFLCLADVADVGELDRMGAR